MSKGPFVHLLDSFNYFEATMTMIFPFNAAASLAKLNAFAPSAVGQMVAKCKL